MDPEVNQVEVFKAALIEHILMIDRNQMAGGFPLGAVEDLYVLIGFAAKTNNVKLSEDDIHEVIEKGTSQRSGYEQVRDPQPIKMNLICRRPGIDISEYQAEVENCKFSNCSHCNCQIYVSKESIEEEVYTFVCVGCAREEQQVNPGIGDRVSKPQQQFARRF